MLAASTLPIPNQRPCGVTHIKAIDSELWTLHLTPFRRDAAVEMFLDGSFRKPLRSFVPLVFRHHFLGALGGPRDGGGWRLRCSMRCSDQMAEQRANIFTPGVKVDGLYDGSEAAGVFHDLHRIVRVDRVNVGRVQTDVQHVGRGANAR
jgi:hypothetical protein